MKKLSFFALCLVLLYAGCKKKDDAAVEQNEQEEYVLTEEDNLYLESLSVPNPPLRDIRGYYGTPLGRTVATTQVATATGKLIDSMLAYGHALCDLKTHLYPQEGSDANKPEHMGLVYSYGQRNFTARLNPPLGNPLHRQYAVYGLDCSGFAFNLLHHAGVNIANFGVDKFQDALNTALKNNAAYKNVVAADLRDLPKTQFRPGDFILWLSKRHMGVLFPDGRGWTIYQSNGDPKPKNSAEHLKNLGPGRGAHTITFPVATTGSRFWGTDYKILRIRDTIAYNLTNDSTKSWKVNPQGATTYCNQSTVNPPIALDDVYEFNIDGTFTHLGGALTSATNCNDGGNYTNTWSFNTSQTSITLGGGINITIQRLDKNHLILVTGDSRIDLIPN